MSEEMYLEHHGIKGQKWGIRRFQNDDGTLTPEGRERYNVKEAVSSAKKQYKDYRNSKDYSDKGFLRKTIASEGGAYAFAKWRGRRHDKNLAKAQEKGDEKKIAKYESKKKAQDAANANMDKYRRQHHTAELAIQNMMPYGLTNHRYRHARARGSGVLSSLVEANLPLVGSIMRWKGNKKAYGKYIVWGDNSGEAI